MITTEVLSMLISLKENIAELAKDTQELINENKDRVDCSGMAAKVDAYKTAIRFVEVKIDYVNGVIVIENIRKQLEDNKRETI